MIAGDRGQRGPVDAGGLHPLLGIGALLAQADLVRAARVAPEPVEHGPARRIKLLDRDDRDVAVLRVDPRERGPGEAQPDERNHAHRDDSQLVIEHWGVLA
jgi:hypothetical protein